MNGNKCYLPFQDVVTKEQGCPGFCQEFLRGVPHQIQQASYGLSCLGAERGGGRELPALGIRNAYLSGRKYEVTLNHVKKVCFFF